MPETILQEKALVLEEHLDSHDADIQIAKDLSAEATDDFSIDLSDPMAQAIFLPSLGSGYINLASQYAEKMEKTEWKRHAKGLHRDGRELNFFNPNSTAFYYPYALFSLGHADLRVDTHWEQLVEKESMIRKRNKDTILIGDSGGFQICKGTGTELKKFDWGNFKSESNDVIRMKTLKWLEATADYSMVLDVPTRGIGTPTYEEIGIKTFRDCLELTLHNNDFYIKNRTEGATKFLNVIHGRDNDECETWFNAVKDLPFEGWAFAWVLASDFEKTCQLFIRMRDGDYLDDRRSWIHALGVSRLSSACIFTYFQQSMRKHINPKITISYDASSPFMSAITGSIYTRLTYDTKSFNFGVTNCFDDPDLRDSTLPFPIRSPIGKKLVFGDICQKEHKDCVDEDGKQFKTSWDGYTVALLSNHNVGMHIKGVTEATNLFNIPVNRKQPHRKDVESVIPAHLLEFRDFCDELFITEKPFEYIARYKGLLNNLSGLKIKNAVSAFDGLLDQGKTISDVIETDYDDSIIDN